MRNEIFLNYRTKVIIESDSHANDYVGAAAAMANIASLGYTFSKPLLDKVATLTRAEQGAFMKEIVPILKDMVGAKVTYRPMFLDFPEGVTTDSMQMLEKRLVAFYGDIFGTEDDDVQECGHLIMKEKWEGPCPICNFALDDVDASSIVNRPALDEVTDMKFIDLGTVAEFEKIFTNLIGGKSSISDTNKSDCRWFIQDYGNDIARLIPDQIPMKEQLAFLANELMVYAPDVELSKLFKTATDVLRLAVAMSDGDISLAVNHKFKRFTRKERKFLLGLLENVKNPTEDMLRWKQKWIRLGERLHPGEYGARFPKSKNAFDVLRKDLPFETFNSKVETNLAAYNVKEAVKLLSTRPGDFARRLDHLLRLSPNDANKVKAEFIKVAANVSTPVLLQIFAFFRSRLDMKSRVVMPKGAVANIKALEVEEIQLSREFFEEFSGAIRDVLVVRFKQGEPLGKVYVDDELENFLVPFSQRTASKALKTIVRGSRVDLGDKNTVRFFIWWKNGEGRVDIDLSATLFDGDWNYKEHVSYTNLRANGYNCVHSGDIVDAPRGAAEFIDVDIESVLAYGGRYMVMQVYSFTSQPYCDLPECFAGIMEREKPGKGGHFDARTVKNKFDLTSDTKVAIPLILDLKERKMIWADLSIKDRLSGWNFNVESYNGKVVQACEAITNLHKVNMKDLAMMHVEGRGELVENREEADVVFALDGGKYNPFDVDTIMAELM